MNPQSKFRENEFSNFFMFKIYTEGYSDSYLHFTDMLVSNEACKKNILL